MTTIFNMSASWNDVVEKGLGVMADYGYNLTETATPDRQMIVAESLRWWVLIWLHSYTSYFWRHHAFNTRHSVSTMLLYSVILNIVGYYVQLWNLSPMTPFERADFERMPMALQSSVATCIAFYKYVKEDNPERERKLGVLCVYHGCVTILFLARCFTRVSAYMAAMDRGLAMVSDYEEKL